MSTEDWRWKIGEAVERIRTRYGHIGRKTGAPFLALCYPLEAEVAVLREWQAQSAALSPDCDLRTVDALKETQEVIAGLGADNIVSSLVEPMPGSDPRDELGHLFVSTLIEAVHRAFGAPGAGKPVVCLTRLAAIYPAAGPRDVMQRLWDSAQSTLDGPVVVLIPGRLRGPRTYAFVDQRNEFMYRGDLL